MGGDDAVRVTKPGDDVPEATAALTERIRLAFEAPLADPDAGGLAPRQTRTPERAGRRAQRRRRGVEHRHPERRARPSRRA